LPYNYFLKMKYVYLFVCLLLSFNLTAQVNANNDAAQIDSLIVAAYKIGSQNVVEALENSKKAAKLLNDNSTNAQNLKVYKSLGTFYYLSANFNLAILNYQKALSFETDNTLTKGQIYYALGNCNFALGNLPNALNLSLEALKIFDNLHENNDLLNAYVSIANIYERQNSFSKAIEFNLKAANIFEQNKNIFRTLTIFENVGKIYALQKKYNLAINYYNKALGIYKNIGNKAGEAITYQNIAKLFYSQMNYKTALVYYQLSYKIAKQANSEVLETSNLLGLGNAQLMLNNYGVAEQNYKLALQKAKLLNQRFELKEAYEGLAIISKSKNNAFESKTFSMLSSQLKDSLFNDSILASVTNLQLLYDKEKTQKQVVLLKQNEELSKIQLIKERQIRKMLIAIVILFVLLTVGFLYFYINNKRISSSLKNQNNKLEIQTEELGRLNNVKDRFFSIISHDLRNNMTTMKLYFDLMSNKKYKPENTEELTKQIASSVENNIDLLENLLVWASSQIKGLPLKFESLNIFELVNKNIALAASIAHQKNITLVNLCMENSRAFADENTINLVLRNLIMNAIKFTNDEGKITVSCKVITSKLQISIADNGVGIDKEKLDQMFTQHKNPSTQGTANEKGTGLGLLLCADFIKQNNGSIYAKSEKGKGAVFTFDLPL
jgi:signal transduction histidine kinase